MKLHWDISAWHDYQYFENHHQQLCLRIQSIINNIAISPYEGIGSPQALKHGLCGFWSRKINEEHRLVYKVDDDTLLIAQCRYHF